jgi:hypothetical protein
MTGFDYLHDAPSDLVDLIHRARLPRRFHGFAVVVLATAIVLMASAGLEMQRVRAAQHVEETAKARFENSRAQLRALRVQWRNLDAIVAEDRRLRRIRSSGPRIATRLARLGNAVGSQVWLRSLHVNAAGYDLEGQAVSLRAFGTTLASFIAREPHDPPRVLHVSRDAETPFALISFAVGGAQP